MPEALSGIGIFYCSRSGGRMYANSKDIGPTVRRFQRCAVERAGPLLAALAERRPWRRAAGARLVGRDAAAWPAVGSAALSPALRRLATVSAAAARITGAAAGMAPSKR